MGNARHVNKRTRNSRTDAIVGTIIVIVAALCVFLYRDRLFPSSNATERSQTAVSSGESYTYETGSRQRFALMGDELAIASTTGLQVLDGDGESVLREVFSMTNPAVCACDDRCVFYDVGGKSVRVVKGGKSTSLDRDEPVTSVSVNSSGFIAVSGEEEGYKGSVKVFDAAMKPVYEWFSGSGYTLDAAVSPDNKSLAVLCAGTSGSEIHLFHLDSEKETATVKIEKDLALRLHYSKSGGLCVLSQKALRFYAPSGKALTTYDFGSNTLEDYEFGSDITAVALGKYVSGGSADLVSFGPEGKALGTVTLSDSPAALFSQGKKLLVLDSANVSVYDSAMRPLKSAAVTTGYESAVLLPGGDVLLLSTHYAEKSELRKS